MRRPKIATVQKEAGSYVTKNTAKRDIRTKGKGSCRALQFKYPFLLLRSFFFFIVLFRQSIFLTTTTNTDRIGQLLFLLAAFVSPNQRFQRSGHFPQAIPLLQTHAEAGEFFFVLSPSRFVATGRGVKGGGFFPIASLVAIPVQAFAASIPLLFLFYHRRRWDNRRRRTEDITGGGEKGAPFSTVQTLSRSSGLKR